LQIDVVDHVAGARAARGIAVVIDVFRAFSVAPHAFACGAARVLPAGEIDEALAMRRRIPGVVLVGERHARRLPGFDAGNSPTDILALDVRGKVVVHTTHAGTQGLVNAVDADEVLTGGFNNLSAVHRYIRDRSPARVTLVRMGHEARERCAEDDLYAESLAGMLRGAPAPTSTSVREALRDAPAAQKFFDPTADWAPEADFTHCTAVDKFDFVLRLRRVDGEPVELTKLAPGER
jgi:2-phosphosulfolactate phosphatase